MGGSAEEAEDFIFAIKKRAYSKGKHKDNIWITEFVSTCFAKRALRWYESLDQETRNDWELLKRAILHEYNDASVPSSLVPTAASSVQGPVLKTVPAAGPAIRTGRIRVESRSDKLKGYVSNTFVDGNWCTVFSSESTAAIFEFDASARTIKFQGGSEDYLIAQSYIPNWIPQKGSYGYAGLLKNIGRTVATKSAWPDEIQADSWSMVNERELVVRWPLKAGGFLELEGTGGTSDNRIYLSSDRQKFLDLNGERLFGPVHFYFESLA